MLPMVVVVVTHAMAPVSKSLRGNPGKIPIDILRDRKDEFRPQLIPNGQCHFPRFDVKISKGESALAS